MLHVFATHATHATHMLHVSCYTKGMKHATCLCYTKDTKHAKRSHPARMLTNMAPHSVPLWSPQLCDHLHPQTDSRSLLSSAHNCADRHCFLSAHHQKIRYYPSSPVASQPAPPPLGPNNANGWALAARKKGVVTTRPPSYKPCSRSLARARSSFGGGAATGRAAVCVCLQVLCVYIKGTTMFSIIGDTMKQWG
jgi:hypothetical protein